MKRKARLVALGVGVGLSLWIGYLLLKPDSLPRLLLGEMPRFLGVQPQTTPDLYRQMARYEGWGWYSSAIRVGEKWTEGHPEDGFNDQTFSMIAGLYLLKAKKDPRHADECISQGLAFRDKSLAVGMKQGGLWTKIWTVDRAAYISEFAGDLSNQQRCVQYKNTHKLLDHMVLLLKDEQIEASRPKSVGADPITPEDVKIALYNTRQRICELEAKQQGAHCGVH